MADISKEKLFCGFEVRDTLNPHIPKIVILVPEESSGLVLVAGITERYYREMISAGEKHLNAFSSISLVNERWDLKRMIEAIKVGIEVDYSTLTEKMRLEYTQNAVSRLKANYDFDPILVSLQPPLRQPA